MGLLFLAIALRSALLAFGSWQDAHLAVKYTDIDYEVVTDAAQFMAAGGSPYQRSTFRYSPLLAAALTPNVFLHRSFGKVLFAAADIVAAALMQRLLARRGAAAKISAACVAVWLFSPFTVTISTRGSGEALVTCMLLGMLELLETGWLVSSALLYGLSVHWRLYPIIYALPIVRHLAMQSGKSSGRVLGILSSLVSVQGVKFAAISGCVFLGLGGAMHRLYGMESLHETYLYHATRIDPRHNFSPYFYPAYLGPAGGTDDAAWAFRVAGLSLQVVLGWAFAAHLEDAFLLQTVALVAFNKVATAQYFVWYLSWLPLVLPDIMQAQNKGRVAMAFAAWTAALGHWLAWAYQLEFQGRPVHAAVWVAGLIWVGANAALLRELAMALIGRRKQRRPKLN